jgi:hypothetical protein
MIIYVDENLAPVLAKGFDILQKPLNADPNFKLKEPIEVRSIAMEFGVGIKDEDWIPKVAKDKDCVITQDYNINRIKHQRELCEAQGLGMFYFRPPSKNGFSYWDMVKMIVKIWPEIIKKASKEARPFSFKLTANSNKLEKM